MDFLKNLSSQFFEHENIPSPSNFHLKTKAKVCVSIHIKTPNTSLCAELFDFPIYSRELPYFKHAKISFELSHQPINLKFF